MSSKTFKPRIAIIGAGPAGLTLGRLLHLKSVPFTIFESDASPSSRSQGGTLDLRTGTGLAAITACGLDEEFLKLARYDGEAIKITDKNLKVWFSAAGSKVDAVKKKTKRGARPEIDRLELRELLLGSVPAECISWGKRLKRVAGEEGVLKLVFEGTGGGEVEEGGFDLIVGADGAWSKTRRWLSEEVPAYSGICGIEQYISDAEARFPDLDRLVNRGSVYMFGDGKSVSAQQMGDGSFRISEWAVRDESWAKEHDAAKMDPKAIKAFHQEEFSDWAPEVRKMLASVDEGGAVSRALCQLPIGFRWENKPGVTVIGDAAHVMVPFAGEGANLSMADAMYLARWIQSSTDKKSLLKNVVKFEEDMFVRAKPIQQISYDNMQDMFFTPGAPRTTIESYLTRMVKHMAGPWAGTLAGAGIYSLYWGYKLFN